MKNNTFHSHHNTLEVAVVEKDEKMMFPMQWSVCQRRKKEKMMMLLLLLLLLKEQNTFLVHIEDIVEVHLMMEVVVANYRLCDDQILAW